MAQLLLVMLILLCILILEFLPNLTPFDDQISTRAFTAHPGMCSDIGSLVHTRIYIYIYLCIYVHGMSLYFNENVPPLSGTRHLPLNHILGQQSHLIFGQHA